MNQRLLAHLMVALFVTLPLAGCTSDSADGNSGAAAPAASGARPQPRFEVEPDAPEREEPAEASPPRPPLLTSRWASPVHLPQANDATLISSEPGILTTSSDEVLVFGTLTDAWRSTDGGRTFDYMGWPRCRHGILCDYGMMGYDSDRVGGGDGDLAILPNGTLAWTGLRSLVPDMSVPFQLSYDNGMNWTQPIDLAEGNTTDRQWIVRAPQNVLHVIWRDMGNSTTSGLWRDTEDRVAIMRRTSLDGGVTWGPITPVLDGRAWAIGKPAVDARTGSIYLPVNSMHLDVYASHDGGATWSASRVPSRELDATLGSFTRFVWPDIAVDLAGNVYVAWAAEENPPVGVPWPLADHAAAARPGVYVSVSADRGSTWSPPQKLSAADHSAIMPTIVAGAPGRVGVAWYETTLPLPGEATPARWRLQFAQTVTADAPQPAWAVAEVVPLVHTGAICTQGVQCEATDRSRGEFFDMAVRPDGFAIISYVQDEEPVDSTGHRTAVAVVRMEGGTPFR